MKYLFFFSIFITTMLHPDLETLKIDPTKIAKTPLLSEVFSDYQLIALETNENSLINSSEIKKIVEHNGRFYIVDTYGSNTVFVFDQSGKFLYNLGYSGEGPGSYIFPQDLIVDDDRAYLLDGQRRRVNIYEQESGNFIQSKRLEFSCGQFIRIDSYFYFYSSNSPYHIIKTDENFKMIDYYLEKRDLRDLGLFEPFTKVSDHIYLFRMAANDTIYSLTDDGFQPYRIIDFGRYSLDKSDLERRKKFNYQMPNKVTHLHSYFENQKLILTKYKLNENHRFTIVNKKEGNTQVYDPRYTKNDITFQSFFPYIFSNHSDRGHFIGWADPEAMDLGKLHAKYPQLSSVNEYSNPVLVLLKL